MQQKSHSVRNASKHIEDPTKFVQQIFEKFQIEITKLKQITKGVNLGQNNKDLGINMSTFAFSEILIWFGL